MRLDGETLSLKKQKKQKNFIINVSDRCNLRCAYCYIADRFNLPTKTITHEILDTFFNKLKEYCLEHKIERIGFTWHGGEPLLAGHSFFSDIIQREKELEAELGLIPTSNIIQTNGLLLKGPLLDLLVDNKFNISVSFDGPKDIHDAIRKALNGRGSYDLVVDAIQRLNEKGYQCGGITVLNSLHLGRERDLYNSYKEAGLSSARINPLFASTATKAHSWRSLTPEEISNFYRNLFDIWIEDEKPIRVEPLVDLTKLAASYRPSVCFFSYKSCSEDWLTITPNGDAYYCNRFGSNDNVKLGNIKENTLDELYANKLRLLGGLVKDIGCPYESYAEVGSFDAEKAPATQAYRSVIAYIRKKLEL